MRFPSVRPRHRVAVLATVGTLASGCGAAHEGSPALRLAGPSLLPTLELPEPEAPPPRSAEAHAPKRVTKNVIVLAMDGVRWQEIFLGVDAQLAAEHRVPQADVVDAEHLLPSLHAAAARGVAIGAPGHGAPIVASGPNYASLPGYLEMLAGKPSPTCTRNDCPATTQPTLLDECRAMPGVGDGDVAVISSWEVIERAASPDTAKMIVSTGRHHGTARDKLPSGDPVLAMIERAEKGWPAPGQNDYRPDRTTAPIALRYLEEKRPRCFFIGLGDPDEHAHLGHYAEYLGSLRALDAFVGRLFATLDEMGDYGRSTSVWITADHGRAHDFAHHGKQPESARVWMIAAGGAIPSRGFVDAPETRRLADLAPSVRVLLGLPSDDAPDAGKPMWEALPGDLPTELHRPAIAAER